MNISFLFENREKISKILYHLLTVVVSAQAGLEKSCCPIAMANTSSCKMSRNFDCLQCKLLNLLWTCRTSRNFKNFPPMSSKPSVKIWPKKDKLVEFIFPRGRVTLEKHVDHKHKSHLSRALVHLGYHSGHNKSLPNMF